MLVSLQAMTIDFSIVDANNVTVIPDTVVTLQELSNTVDNNCRCTMPTIPTQVAANVWPKLRSAVPGLG